MTVLQKWTTPCHLDGPCGAQLTAMSCMAVKREADIEFRVPYSQRYLVLDIVGLW